MASLFPVAESQSTGAPSNNMLERQTSLGSLYKTVLEQAVKLYGTLSTHSIEEHVQVVVTLLD